MMDLETYIPYVKELRQRLIRSVIVFLSLFFIFFWQDETLYHWISKPLLSNLPSNGHMIATDVIAPFWIPMKLAFFAAFFISAPFCFFELWGFVAPALFQKERTLFLTVLLASTLLFYLGASFSFFVICPMAMHFFLNAAPKEVWVMTDISNYLQFITQLLVGGGLAFQVPVITFICLKLQWVSAATLSQLRPYIIVGAFVLGMLLTPPDVVSQILLALPMWGLFELGLCLSKWSEIKFKKENSLKNTTVML